MYFYKQNSSIGSLNYTPNKTFITASINHYKPVSKFSIAKVLRKKSFSLTCREACIIQDPKVYDLSL